MKKIIFLLAMIIVTAACSKHNDPTPQARVASVTQTSNTSSCMVKMNLPNDTIRQQYTSTSCRIDTITLTGTELRLTYAMSGADGSLAQLVMIMPISGGPGAASVTTTGPFYGTWQFLGTNGTSYSMTGQYNYSYYGSTVAGQYTLYSSGVTVSIYNGVFTSSR